MGVIKKTANFAAVIAQNGNPLLMGAGIRVDVSDSALRAGLKDLTMPQFIQPSFKISL